MKKYGAKIFLINGPAKSGKDLFVTYVGSHYDIISDSIINNIKHIAKSEFGWSPSSKTEKDRKFLADLFTIANEYSNYAERELDRIITSYIESPARAKVRALFICVRNPKYIQYVVDKYNVYDISVKTVCITRNGVNLIESNSEDKLVFDMEYDIYIENNGTTVDLYLESKRFAEKYIAKTDAIISNKKIAICGSMKYYTQMAKLAVKLMRNDNIVFLPLADTDSRDGYQLKISDDDIDNIQYHYLKKIDMSDVVIIFKKPDGSIGNDTLRECEYAKCKNKVVKYEIAKDVINIGRDK